MSEYILKNSKGSNTHKKDLNIATKLESDLDEIRKVRSRLETADVLGWDLTDIRILVLSKEGNLSILELAERLNIQHTTLLNHLKILESNGWIVRVKDSKAKNRYFIQRSKAFEEKYATAIDPMGRILKL